jgi:Rrf2 family protein
MYLLKQCWALTRAGILFSRKGRVGGYYLARPADQITLLEIIEAVNGPLRSPVHGMRGKEAAAVDAKLRHIFQQTTDQQRKQLEKVRLSDLMATNGNRRK